MSIDITNNFSAGNYRVNIQSLMQTAKWLAREYNVSDHGLSILLLDDEEMQWYNRQYRNKDNSTNVLSFPFAEGADTSLSTIPIKELGDILISVETAFREAQGNNQSLDDRLFWLLTHGFLHLLGYDHERSEDEAEKMYLLEKDLITRLQKDRRKKMTQLAINVDHVATIRQARGITEPDPVTAAAICELAGASGIVVHLREDRRHIQDRDVHLLRQTVKTKLNLEMGATKEIINIALDVKPDLITLVPEKRQELTTEGGLDVLNQKKKLAKSIAKMSKANIPVSIFVDPDEEQIKASYDIGATFVEIHTGRYCDATSEEIQNIEFQLVAEAAESAYQMGLRVNAGHGLDYQTTARVAGIDAIEELSIGHAIITRAVFSGLDHAVKDMLAVIQNSVAYF